MYGQLYLIFNETDDGLAMLTASFYPNSTLLSSLEEVAVDFHRVYVFLNYKYLLDVIQKGFSSCINDIDDDGEETCRSFTLKFVVGNNNSNIKNYVKGVMDRINEHPDNLLDMICYADDSCREDITALYLYAARKLILDLEWLNK